MLQKKKHKTKKKHSGFMILLTIVFVILAIMCFSAQFISPYKYLLFQYLSLCMPFVLGICLLLLLYWIIKRSCFLLLPMFCILINLGFIFAMFNFGLNHDNEAKYDVRLASFNVHNFSGGQNFIPVTHFAAEQNIDVLCMQEFQDYSSDKILDYFYQYKYYVTCNGLAILSKYPIVDSKEINYTNRGREILCADILIGIDTLKVITTHLQTTGVSAIKRRFIKNGYISVAGEENNFSYNAKVRTTQAIELSDLIAKQNKPMIICGDFNDTPASYVYRKIKGNLQDGFRATGKGYCSTYSAFKCLLRIDYIFNSRDLETLCYDVPDVNLSDHKAVIVNLKFK